MTAILDERLRQLSKRVLGRAHLLEIALVVIARRDDSFVFEDLYDELRESALGARLDPPSASAVRSDLDRLRELNAIERLPRARGELSLREIRRPKAAFWNLVRELEPDAQSPTRDKDRRRRAP